jgi:ABC-2 type transport system permease protein
MTTGSTGLGAPGAVTTVSVRARGNVPPATRVMPPGRYTLAGMLSSEWTKLRTVRSTVWSLALVVVISIGVSVLATAETRSHWAPSDAFGFDPTRLSLIGLFFAQLVIGVLGILVMSSEYGTGTIRATLSATPRRPLVLLAKVIVFGAVALAASEVVAVLSFLIGQSLLTAPAPHTTLASASALRAVLGSGLYLCVLGLLALGLATIIRHTAGAIGAFVAILLVAPIIVSALPISLSNSVERFLPDRIGQTMISLHQDTPNAFSAWVGFAVLCMYAVALLVIGGVMMVRRDA